MRLFRRRRNTSTVVGDMLMAKFNQMEAIYEDALTGMSANAVLNSVFGGNPFTTSDAALGMAIGDQLIERGFALAVNNDTLTFTHPDDGSPDGGGVVIIVETPNGDVCVALAPKTSEAK